MFALALLALIGSVHGKIKCKNLSSKTQCHGAIESEGGLCMWQNNRCISGEDYVVDETQVCLSQLDYNSCNRYAPCSFINMQCAFTQACEDVTSKDMCKTVHGCSWNHECAPYGEAAGEAQDCREEENSMDCEGDPERNCFWQGVSCDVFDPSNNCPYLKTQWKCESYRCLWSAETNSCSLFNRLDFCPTLTTQQECEQYSCMWMFGKKCMDHTVFGEDGTMQMPSKAPVLSPTSFFPTTTWEPTSYPTVAMPCKVGPKHMHCPYRGGHCDNKNPSTSEEGADCVTDCTGHKGMFWCYTDMESNMWGWCYQQHPQECHPPTAIPTSRPTVTSPFVISQPLCLTGVKGLSCPDGSTNCGIDIASTADEDQKCITDCVEEAGKFWCYTNLSPFKLWGWCKVQADHTCGNGKRNSIQVQKPFKDQAQSYPNSAQAPPDSNKGGWLGLSDHAILAGCIASSACLVLCICYFAWAVSKRYSVPDMVDLDFIRDVDAFGFSEYSHYSSADSPRV